jgi:hypothetical protein
VRLEEVVRAVAGRVPERRVGDADVDDRRAGVRPEALEEEPELVAPATQ